MLRILTWNSNTGFEKMQSQDSPSLAQGSPAPVKSCANPSIKRKRSFDGSGFSLIPDMSFARPLAADPVQKPSTPQCVPVNTNALPVSTVTQSATSIPSVHVTQRATDDKMDDVDLSCPTVVKSREEARLTTMRQTISSQINLEILLKHRELRLIDQELAKCQIALEQLRRCSEIPYPAMQQSSEQVSSGTGAAVRKAGQKNAARSPAPWGVVDGPYSRHYAKWLLPDAQFDTDEFDGTKQMSHTVLPAHGHSTRGHYTDFAQMVGKPSRTQRALNAGLPPGYAEPKSKPTGPMILKRKSDGKMVKLVCPDCQRFDFGSAQGFINHCRIGHQRNFASHDAAAEGCGQPMEVNTNVMALKCSESAPVTPITAAPTVTPVATPITPPVFNSTAVHPLVKSANAIPKDVLTKPLIRGGCVPKPNRKARTTKASSAPTSSCSATPNLAAYIGGRGLTLNLQDAVTDARIKPEMPDEVVDDDVEMETPLPTPVENSRRPQVAGKKHPVKSTDRIGKSRKPSFSQFQNHGDHPGAFSNIDTPAEEGHHGYFMPLLASPTNDSTQAPSLIDDDEEMDPQSPPSSDETDDSEIHFHVRDDDHSEETTDLRSSEMQAPPTACAQPTQDAQNAQSVASTQAPFVRPLSSKSERPMNFVAEQPRAEDRNDKKRRRIGN